MRMDNWKQTVALTGGLSIALLAISTHGALVTPAERLDASPVRGGECNYEGYANRNCSLFGGACGGVLNVASNGGTAAQSTGGNVAAGQCTGEECPVKGPHETTELTTEGCSAAS